MSIETLTVVFQHAPFAGRDKLILLAIANHDGDAGAFPAISTLARVGNCSVASVKRSLATLETSGAIIKHVQKGGMNVPDYARTNLYEVMVECPPNCDKTRKHKPIDKDLPASSMLWINPRSTLTPGSVSEPPPRSVGERGGSSVGEPLTVREPSKNSKTPSPSPSTSPEKKIKCWSCAELHAGKGSYCTSCSSRGFNTPIISCQHDGCGLTRRRSYPGQQTFDCKGH